MKSILFTIVSILVSLEVFADIELYQNEPKEIEGTRIETVLGQAKALCPLHRTSLPIYNSQVKLGSKVVLVKLGPIDNEVRQVTVVFDRFYRNGQEKELGSYSYPCDVSKRNTEAIFCPDCK